MPESTSQKKLRAVDGTEFTFSSWQRDGGSALMSPGDSRFTAACPQHGEIDSSYESITVMFAVRDHADAEHGGVVSHGDLLDLGPAIDLR